ncbi:hypothetical protein DWW36_04390 [Erysipelotrichaceae bacterium AF15-26LB]|nr:hypothetical protein DWX45_06885 [Erysipelotrichaceae bacterium AF19-24AC]RJV91061.1 hypothetical protein DWW36_04390 [Erysipelotrichaceae bacterium AF15-26LB]
MRYLPYCVQMSFFNMINSTDMQVNISVKLPNLCRSVFRDMGISACEMAAAFGKSCRCEYGKKKDACE